MNEFESTKEMLGRSRKERKEIYIKLKAAEAEIERRGECMEEMGEALQFLGHTVIDDWFDSDGKVKPCTPEVKE